MRDFYEGVGKGDTAGVWEGSPNLRPGLPGTASEDARQGRESRQGGGDDMMFVMSSAPLGGQPPAFGPPRDIWGQKNAEGFCKC